MIKNIAFLMLLTTFLVINTGCYLEKESRYTDFNEDLPQNIVTLRSNENKEHPIDTGFQYTPLLYATVSDISICDLGNSLYCFQGKRIESYGPLFLHLKSETSHYDIHGHQYEYAKSNNIFGIFSRQQKLSWHPGDTALIKNDAPVEKHSCEFSTKHKHLTDETNYLGIINLGFVDVISFEKRNHIKKQTTRRKFHILSGLLGYESHERGDKFRLLYLRIPMPW